MFGQPQHEVGVGCIHGDEEVRVRLAQQGQRFAQHARVVDQGLEVAFALAQVKQHGALARRCQRRHERQGGVVDEGVGPLRFRRRGADQPPVAARRVGMAAAGQVEGQILRVGRRVAVEVPPDVAAGDEHRHTTAQRRPRPRPVALQVLVEEGDAQGHQVDDGMRPHRVRAVGRLAAGIALAVVPGADEQVAVLCACGMGFQLAPERVGTDAHVEVAVDHKRRDVDAREVLVGQGARPEPVVEGRVLKHVAVVSQEVALQVAVGGFQRRAACQALQHGGLREHRHRAHESRLEFVERLDLQQPHPVHRVLALEDATAVGHLAEEVDAGHGGHDAAQVRRPCAGGRQLRHRGIAAAVHAHGTGAPGLGRDPLHRVVTVVTVVRRIEGEVALAGAHPADQLDDHGIPGFDVAQHAQALEAHHRFLVRRAQQDGRCGPRAKKGTGGQPDVRVQTHPIAHGQADAVIGQRHRLGGRQRRACTGTLQQAQRTGRWGRLIPRLAHAAALRSYPVLRL